MVLPKVVMGEYGGMEEGWYFPGTLQAGAQRPDHGSVPKDIPLKWKRGDGTITTA